MKATRTLQSLILGRANNLNAIRLLLAVLVILAHSFPLATGKEGDPLFILTRGQTTSGGLAVNLFFFISGLLVTMSWLKCDSMNEYLRHRVLRIVPGYLCALGFSFIVALIFAAHPFANLFTRVLNFEDVIYLGYQGVVGDWIFPNNPFPHYANGSLWTISQEFKCYLLIAFIGLFGWFKFRKLALMIFVVYFLSRFGLDVFRGVDIEHSDHRFFTFFLAGMCAWLWRDKIIIHSGIAAIALVATAVSIRFAPAFTMLMPIALCYLVLWGAYAYRLKAVAWCERTDLSYGTYLFAFPVQQILVAVGVTNPWALFGLATPLVLGLAFISWFAVEQPCLKLKRNNFSDQDPALPDSNKQRLN